MSERDFRAHFLASIGIQNIKLQTRGLSIDGEMVDIEEITKRLLSSTSSELSNIRITIWEFLLGIVPRYKSVRVHFQEQKKEQWSVIVNTTNLILPNLSFTNHNAHYILALHYIQTGELSVMKSDNRVTCGNDGQDDCKLQLIDRLLPLMKHTDQMNQYFVINAILVMLDQLSSKTDIVQRIIRKIYRFDQNFAEKLKHREIMDVLSNLVRSCYVKSLPSCCFTKLLDHIIARRSTQSLVMVGFELLTKNAVVLMWRQPVESLAEEIKTLRLTAHQICAGNFLEPIR